MPRYIQIHKAAILRTLHQHTIRSYQQHGEIIGTMTDNNHEVGHDDADKTQRH